MGGKGGPMPQELALQDFCGQRCIPSGVDIERDRHGECVREWGKGA